MGAIASLITSLTIVYSTVYSDADQRKHQSSASLGFVWGIHRGPVNSPHKWPVTRKMFPFDDVIMGSDNGRLSVQHHVITEPIIISCWWSTMISCWCAMCSSDFSMLADFWTTVALAPSSVMSLLTVLTPKVIMSGPLNSLNQFCPHALCEVVGCWLFGRVGWVGWWCLVGGWFTPSVRPAWMDYFHIWQNDH